MPRAVAAHGASGSRSKYRRDETNLTLDYHETRQFAYLQDHTISSSLEGMYDEIKRDPLAEKKYFLSVYLDDWPRKLGRVFKPVVNWASQPVAFLSAQVGYPNTRGELQWTGKSFQKADGDDARWTLGITQKERQRRREPTGGWDPDKTFIKRKVHMLEPGDGFANPFVVTQIDQNVIDLDPEPNGTAMNDTTLEVRADSAGRLAVGPISLGAVLDDARQTVEVTFDPTDDRWAVARTRAGPDGPWLYGDQDQPRFWSIYTGDPTFRPFFRYKVHVVVKGSLFAKGQAWHGPWVEANGNGPITIAVPTPDSEGVVPKEAPPIMVVGADGKVVREGMSRPGPRAACRRNQADDRRGVRRGYQLLARQTRGTRRGGAGRAGGVVSVRPVERRRLQWEGRGGSGIPRARGHGLARIRPAQARGWCGRRMTIVDGAAAGGDGAGRRRAVAGPAAGVDWIEIPGRDPGDRVLYALPDAATPVDPADECATRPEGQGRRATRGSTSSVPPN